MNRDIIPGRKKGFDGVIVPDTLKSSIKVLAALACQA